MNIMFTDHGEKRKHQRNISKRSVKKTLNKARIPRGNWTLYITNKQLNFAIVGKKENKQIIIKTVINDPKYLRITGKNPFVRAV